MIGRAPTMRAVRRRYGAVAVVLAGAAVVAIAAVAPEGVHSPAEVRAGFASAGVPLAPIQGLLPGCRSRWISYWERLTEPERPSISCVQAIFEARGIPVSVYVFPDESFVEPFVAQSEQLRQGFVVARSNVLVLGEPGHAPVHVALEGLG